METQNLVPANNDRNANYRLYKGFAFLGGFENILQAKQYANSIEQENYHSVYTLKGENYTDQWSVVIEQTPKTLEVVVPKEQPTQISAKIFCANPPSDNPPKRGEQYYFENSNYFSFAKEIQHTVFTPNSFGAIFYFTKYQKVLIDGVFENKNGVFVGYWYKNGTYRTCKIDEMKSLNDNQVLLIGLLP